MPNPFGDSEAQKKSTNPFGDTEIETKDLGGGKTQINTRQPGLETTDTVNQTQQPYSNNYRPGPPNSPASNPAQTPPTLQEMMGRGANALNGAVMGSPAGPLGMAGGFAMGLGQQPAQNPGMQIGATAGDLLANRFLPGADAGSMLTRLMRGGGITGSMMGGATLGAQFDGMMDRGQGKDTQTPYGTIVMYGAATAPFQGLKALLPGNLTGSPLSQATRQLSDKTGVEYPLSFSQSSGFGQGLESAVSVGSRPSKNLAAGQTQAAVDAVQKITGQPLSSIQTAAETGAKVSFDARKLVGNWVRNWKDTHTTTEETQVPSSILDPSGNPTMTTVSKSIRPSAVDWSDFQSQFGLSSMERDSLFRAIHGDPTKFVDAMLGGKGQGSIQGAVRLRAMMNILPDDSMQQLGNGVVMRVLGKSGAFQEGVNGITLSGTKFQQAITDAEPQLKLILGNDRAQALKTLAQVVKDTDPASRTNPLAISQAKRTLSYAANKGAFTLMSVGGGAAAGMGAGGQHLLAAGAGMAIGGATVVPISVLISKIMMDPGAVKLLQGVANGDASAGKAFVRSLVSGVTEKPQDETQTPTPASRLQGLFQ